MKKLSLVAVIMVILALLAQGCREPGADDFSKVHKMLSELETYRVTAEIIVQGNKLVGTYVVEQYFKYPDIYRLEVLEPEDKKGKVTLYDGNRIIIRHPLIDQTYTLEGFKEVEETGMFPGYFARNLFCGEEADYDVEEVDGMECVVIETLIPGNNSYRHSQILYIDREKVIPVKMEVLNSKGEVTVTVNYRDFIYNPPLDDKLFRDVQ